MKYVFGMINDIDAKYYILSPILKYNEIYKKCKYYKYSK